MTVPFTQPIEGTFTVSSFEAGGVTVSSTLTAGQYANAYYVRFISGRAAGLWTTITNNGVGDFTLADAGVLALVDQSSQFRVYKHHTLGSLFPKGMYGVSYTNGTTVLIYANNIAAMQQNKSAAKTASYTTSGGGRWTGSGISSTTILPPETLFIVRNNSSSALTMYTMGYVPDYTVQMLIAPAGDLVIGSGYPTPVVLNNSGLGGSTGRTVLFYDANATGTNKSASKTASYTTSGGGRWTGSGITGNELIYPSQAVTLRLPAGETATQITISRPY